MAENLPPEPVTPATAPAAVCPWCSAQLPDPAAPTCPSCGARLHEDETVEIPGVTSVSTTHRAAPLPAPRGVLRPLGSIFGGEEVIDLPSEAELPALAPPDQQVRMEMLRLELDARLRDLQAEVTSIETEAATSEGTVPAAAPADAVPPVEPATAAPGDEAPAERSAEPPAGLGPG